MQVSVRTVQRQSTIGEADGTRSHLTLLAETRRGYANLCRLSSIAFGLRETDAAAKEERRLWNSPNNQAAVTETEQHLADVRASLKTQADLLAEVAAMRQRFAAAEKALELAAFRCQEEGWTDLADRLTTCIRLLQKPNAAAGGEKGGES